MEFVRANAVMLIVNLVYSVVALFVGVAAIRILDRLVLKKNDLEKEIKAGNLAAAIFASTLLFFVAVIISGAISN